MPCEPLRQLRALSSKTCAFVTALAVLTGASPGVQAQAPSSQSLKAQRSELAKYVTSGRAGLWGLQQLLLQESGITQEDLPKLAEVQLNDAQKYAFHMAVAQLEAHARIYKTLKPEFPSTENAAAVFQFAQAATALTQVAASRALQQSLQEAQDNQLRPLLRHLAGAKPALFEGWTGTLRNGGSREVVRDKIEKALESYRARFTQAAVEQVEGLEVEQKELLAQASAQTNKIVSAVERVKDDLSKQKQLFNVSDKLLREMENEFEGSASVATAQLTGAMRRMAALEVGLRLQAAKMEAKVKPLLDAQELSATTAKSLRDFVGGQNLSALDAVRAPLLLATLTSNPDKLMAAAVERTLGQLPAGTIERLAKVATSAQNLEMDFGGWQQTGNTLNGVATLLVSIDPGLSDSVAQVTSLIATASNFIAVGQSIIQTVSQVGSGLSTFTQMSSFAATFFTTGGVGTALSVLSGMGSLGGLFGGGSKRDDGAILAQLNVINQKLDLVLQNQRKTMEAIVSVSEQLQAATNQIVQDIQKVSLQVTRVELALFTVSVKEQRVPCASLYEDAVKKHQYNTSTGTFPSGERQRFWAGALQVGQPTAPDTMRQCREFLQHVGAYGAEPHPYLLDESRDFSQKNLGPSAGVPKELARSAEAARYGPMRDLMLSLQGDDFSLTDSCIDEVFLPQALEAPRRFDEIVPLDKACVAKADFRPQDWVSTKLAAPSFVLQRMLHENSVREFALFADFFAPFVDMEVALQDQSREDRKATLKTIQTNVASSFDVLTRKAPMCVAKPKLGIATTNSGENLYHSALVTVNAALAQQYLLSGAGIALQTASVLKEPANSFGSGASAFKPSPPKNGAATSDKRAGWEQFEKIAVGQATGDLDFNGQPKGGAAPEDPDYSALRAAWLAARAQGASDEEFGADCNVPKNYFARPYETVACVLHANPTFANNVLQALLLEHLREPVALPGWAVAHKPALANLRASAMPVSLYEKMLSASGDSSLFQGFLSKGLPVVYLQGRRPGWFLKLRKHTGEYWFWRLPEASLLASGHVYYPFSEGPLREAQALLTSRLADYAAMCIPSALRDNAKLLSRSAFFAPPRRPLEQDK